MKHEAREAREFTSIERRLASEDPAMGQRIKALNRQFSNKPTKKAPGWDSVAFVVVGFLAMTALILFSIFTPRVADQEPTQTNGTSSTQHVAPSSPISP
ncbi:DUF3040 domain-containing protein [Streptomyces sp. NPDC058864]